MKHILLLLLLIPVGLIAQERWADGPYSMADISKIKSGDKPQASFIVRTSGANIDLFRKNDGIAFSGRRPFNVYPNPAISDARAVWNSDESGLTWRLYMISSDGKPLFLRKGTTVVGTNTINFDMSDYPIGTYFLQLMIDGKDRNFGDGRTEIIRLMKVVK